MKVGILSFAHMHAHSYVMALKQMGVEALIWDEDPARGERMSQALQIPYQADLDQVLAQVQAVIICSANADHAHLTVAAAQAGVHVLVEKPIATSISDAKRMIAACKEAGVKLQVAFPVRYLPTVQRVREIVRSGQLGRILAIKGTNHGRNPGGWFVEKERSGGGAVMDHTVHVVDVIRWILEKEFTEVYAEASNLMEGREIDDCGMLSMEMEDGVFVTLDPSWSRPKKSFPTWGDVTMEIIGTEGVLALDAFGQQLAVYDDKVDHAQWHYWGGDMDFNLVRDFLEAVENGTPTKVTGEDGLRALEVALAAYKSTETHKSIPISQIS